MQPTSNIHPGDLVIAKVRGWPYWPARVLNVQETARARKFEVHFFCTFQTAVVQHGSVLKFNEETKKMLGYNGKRKDIRECLKLAIEEIEKDIFMPPPTKRSRTSDSTGSSPGAASTGEALPQGKVGLGSAAAAAAGSDNPPRTRSSRKSSPDIIDAPYQSLKLPETRSRAVSGESKKRSSKSKPLAEESTVALEPVAQFSGSSIPDGFKDDTAFETDDQVSEAADSWSTDDADDEDSYCSTEYEDQEEEEEEDEESRLINQFCDDLNIQPKWKDDEDELEVWRKKLASPLDWFNHVQANGMVKPLPFKLKCEKGTPFYEANKLVMDKKYGIDLDEWLAANRWLKHQIPKQGGTAPGGETESAPEQ